MKKYLSIILTLVLILTGCTSGISQADYDAMLAERNAALEENRILKEKLAIYLPDQNLSETKSIIEESIETDVPIDNNSELLNADTTLNFTESVYFQNNTLEFTFLDHTEFSEIWVDGVYKCGSDFEPGEYYILPLYDSWPAYGVSDSPNDFSFSYYGLIQKVNIKEGQYINLGFGAVMVLADEVDTGNWQKYGVFLVGQDLPAGEYKVETSTSEYKTEIINIQGIHGSYQVCDTSIENNELSCEKLFSKQAYVSLKEGNYLIVVNAKLVLS